MEKILNNALLKKIIIAAIVIFIAVTLWLLVKKFYRRFLKNTDNKTINTFARVTVGIIRFALFLVTSLIILQICGVNVTSAIAGIGIIGAVIGLAWQDFMKDVIMGIHIMMDKFYSIGDCVEYDGEEAKVIEFTMKTTKLELLKDKSVICICNRNIEQIKRLENIMELTIPMPYDASLSSVSDLMSDICYHISATTGIIACTYKGAVQFDESSIPYKIWVECSPADRYDVKIICMKTIIEAIERSNIDIPFNQLDVHMK